MIAPIIPKDHDTVFLVEAIFVSTCFLLCRLFITNILAVRNFNVIYWQLGSLSARIDGYE